MTRPALRRRLLLLGLLPLLLALAFAAKVGSMLVLDHDGRASYGDAQWGDARGSFAANGTLNVLEPWVAPFGEGTARYRDGDARGAVRALASALLDVPADEECRVRINLSLAHEGVGDAARAGGDPAAARVAYRAGVVALADCLGLTAATSDSRTPEDPLVDPATDPATDQAAAGADTEVGGARVGDARAVDTRLREKLAEARAAADAAEQVPDDPAEAQQRDDLEERNQQGEDQRDQSEQRQEDERDEQDPPEPSEPPPPSQSPTGDSEDPPPPVYEW